MFSKSPLDQQSLNVEHHLQLTSHHLHAHPIPQSPTDRKETGSACAIEGAKVLTNSNEKLEQQYNKILKENDGKLFEVTVKKAGQASLMTSQSMLRQGYPLMIEQVLQRSLTQNMAGAGGMRMHPLFQIKYTPRSRCKLHKVCKEKLEAQERAVAIRNAMLLD